jgi:hypothetical protein
VWTDKRLVWDKDKYKTDVIQLSANDVWLPRLRFFDSIQGIGFISLICLAHKNPAFSNKFDDLERLVQSETSL